MRDPIAEPIVEIWHKSSCSRAFRETSGEVVFLEEIASVSGIPIIDRADRVPIQAPFYAALYAWLRTFQVEMLSDR